MHKHCKGCKFHWKGGAIPKYQDWCSKFSDIASHKVGHCLLMKGKENVPIN